MRKIVQIFVAFSEKLNFTGFTQLKGVNMKSFIELNINYIGTKIRKKDL